jgi:hypothetical protein
MTGSDVKTGRGDAGTTGAGRGGRVGRTARRLTTETKQFFKTSEWWTYVVILVAILIAGNSIEGEEGGGDFFAADKVWLYVTILTVGYLISRGIAKSGVRDPYWDDGGDRDADR